MCVSLLPNSKCELSLPRPIYQLVSVEFEPAAAVALSTLPRFLLPNDQRRPDSEHDFSPVGNLTIPADALILSYSDWKQEEICL